MKIGPKNGAYEVIIPDSWTYDESGDSFDIYKNGGVGAMSISDYIIPPRYNFVIDVEMLDFLKSINDPPVFKLEDIQYLPGNWCSAEVIKDGEFFKVWLYYKYRSAIFITWVCDVADKNVDISEVEQIVSSLTLGRLDMFQ